eukprot:CAMPEP_0194065714 /NCGR_PEP_ID=MMETSP0009_2-20130614/85623_1 /TAXON_ID=210454 /ORGANISM="Grammatophora oceanica, Strain CCMP 410" /LENGTH=460 /DNA_ID=CAMNT_0038718593 /DNA_START=473 /DNA_END=1855 /DNA_ORIENTATION=-
MMNTLFGGYSTLKTGPRERRHEEESELLGDTSSTTAATFDTASAASSSTTSSSAHDPSRMNHESDRTTKTGFRTSIKVSRPPDHNRTLVYDDKQTHWEVLTQIYGSVWPKVLPFCLVNVGWTLLIYALKKKGVIDLTFGSIAGHNFMAIMVSFLVVSRAQITYARFMEAREHLSTAFRSCREIVQFTCCLTMEHQESRAKQWRQEVAYRTILMLRIAVAAIEYRSSRVHTWEVLPEQQDSLDLVCDDHAEPLAAGSFRLSRWSHGDRSMVDENFRAPIILAYNVRETIMRQRNGNYLKARMHVNEELRILNYVGDFMQSFHGLQKLITTPFPFPLVQMCRTFLFFWIFSLPLVLLNQMEEVWHVCVMMFIVTYGFLGVEYVSMELDDPFGEDPNDFDDLGMAQVVFEDIYINICKTDGIASAAELRCKVSERVSKGSALENFRRDAQEPSFWRRTTSSAV